MLRSPARLVLLLALVLAGFTTVPPQVEAQDFVLGETSILVPANDEVSLQFETFCLDFGLEFPEQIGTPLERADEPILRALKVAIEEGYTDSEPLQVQLAIWRIIEDEWVYPEEEVPHDLAQQILDMAEDAVVDPLEGDGMPLTEAVNQGLVTVDSQDFTAVDAPTQQLPDGISYKGQGTLVITNQTDEDVQIFFPYGTVFNPGPTSDQNIVAYATELEQLPTPTPTATDTPVPTDTPTPTNTSTPTDTATPVPTDTPMPTDTATPVPTDTPTPLPTDTATPTNTATSLPTDTPMPTDTATPAPTDTATPVPTPEELPVTGGSQPPASSGSLLPWLMTLLGVGALGSTGFWFRRRTRR